MKILYTSIILLVLGALVYGQDNYSVQIKVHEKKQKVYKNYSEVDFKIYASNTFGDILYKLKDHTISVLRTSDQELIHFTKDSLLSTKLKFGEYHVYLNDSTYTPPAKDGQIDDPKEIDGMGNRIEIISIPNFRQNHVYIGLIHLKDSTDAVVKVRVPENRVQSLFQPPQIQLLKPVVYVYAEEDLKTTIKLDVKGDLSFSYPVYNNGWNIEVKDHKLWVNGKEYPYLFWEGNRINPFKIEKGAVVHKKNLLAYLEESCAKLGLNFKEKTDFITFWYPKLQQYDAVKLQFLDTEAYHRQVASIEFGTTPDAIQRIYLLAQPCATNDVLEMQEFEKIERKGFTVIEWGGSILPQTIRVNQIK